MLCYLNVSVRLSLSAKISQPWNNISLSQQISISQKYSQPNTVLVRLKRIAKVQFTNC
jgi:hypothetical protein